MKTLPTNKLMSLLEIGQIFTVHTEKASVEVILSNSTGRKESDIVGENQNKQFKLNDNYDGLASIEFVSTAESVVVSTP